MSNYNFQVLRAGINTTFQDKGRNNLYHIGIPFSGAMDNRNYLIANYLAGNKKNTTVIEFAYQGPLLKFNGEKICLAITGDVTFNIIKNFTNQNIIIISTDKAAKPKSILGLTKRISEIISLSYKNTNSKI